MVIWTTTATCWNFRIFWQRYHFSKLGSLRYQLTRLCQKNLWAFLRFVGISCLVIIIRFCLLHSSYSSPCHQFGHTHTHALTHTTTHNHIYTLFTSRSHSHMLFLSLCISHTFSYTHLHMDTHTNNTCFVSLNKFSRNSFSQIGEISDDVKSLLRPFTQN